MTPGNPVVGGTVLRRPAIQSPNYVAGVSGWTINADGSAEFNNLTIRGEFIGSTYVINSTGIFVYNGTPASGNLIASVAAAAGVDSHGNNYLEGVGSYASTFATALTGGAVQLYTGNLTITWVFAAEIETDSGEDMQLIANGSIYANGNLIS